MTDADLFLPGVPQDHVLARLAVAGGKEVESGKLRSPESSAALAVNAFGWFKYRASLLPAFPGLAGIDWPAIDVEVEHCARFPWRGGRHPWLDALVETPQAIIGVESKRFEPFRDAKSVVLSAAYDRPVWGKNMQPFEVMRDRLRSGDAAFAHLDAVQLVKHAFGLVTEAGRKGKRPYLLYLYAEPAERNGRAIAGADIQRHRSEVASFGAEIAGAEVGFAALSYREWLTAFAAHPDRDVRAHGIALSARFNP